MPTTNAPVASLVDSEDRINAMREALGLPDIDNRALTSIEAFLLEAYDVGRFVGEKGESIDSHRLLRELFDLGNEFVEKLTVNI